MLIDKYTVRMIVGLVSGTFLLIILTLLIFRLITNHYTEEIPGQDDSKIGGEYLSWDEVDRIFPKQAKAVVIDYDTGLQFKIQRRGGSSHADVQPLTAEDTAIMKNIYGGRWTWKRRAVKLQLYDGRIIAASMNGMPHGQGAIPGNNFNGHFCIHFKDCKTHGSKKVDLAHQMMVWKAANILDQKLPGLTAEETIALFFTAVDQHELNIAGKMLKSGADTELWSDKLNNIENIKAENIKKIAEDTFSINIRIIFKDSKHEYRQDIIVKTVFPGPYWKIDADDMLPQLDRASWTVFEQLGTYLPEEDWETE